MDLDRRGFLTAVAGIIPVAALPLGLPEPTAAEKAIEKLPEYLKPEFTEFTVSPWTPCHAQAGMEAQMFWSVRFNGECRMYCYRTMHLDKDNRSSHDVAEAIRNCFHECQKDIRTLSEIKLPCSVDEVSKVVSALWGYPQDLRFCDVPERVTSISFVKAPIGSPIMYVELRGGQA